MHFITCSQREKESERNDKIYWLCAFKYILQNIYSFRYAEKISHSIWNCHKMNCVSLSNLKYAISLIFIFDLMIFSVGIRLSSRNAVFFLFSLEAIFLLTFSTLSDFEGCSTFGTWISTTIKWAWKAFFFIFNGFQTKTVNASSKCVNEPKVESNGMSEDVKH